MNLTDLVQEIKNELAAGPAIADISCRDIVVKLGSPRGSPGAEGVGFIATARGVTGTGRSIFKADSPRLRRSSPRYDAGVKLKRFLEAEVVGSVSGACADPRWRPIECRTRFPSKPGSKCFTQSASMAASRRAPVSNKELRLRQEVYYFLGDTRGFFR